MHGFPRTKHGIPWKRVFPWKSKFHGHCPWKRMLLSMDIDKVVHGKQRSFHGKLRPAWKVVHGQRK